MNFQKLFLSGILCLCLIKSTFAQDEIVPQIQTFFDTYQKEFPSEKAYLHLDKSTYTLGDDLWFSAYLTAGALHMPSPLSKTLYVDLFDGDGLLLQQKTLFLENGRGSGDFALPAFGKPGIYQIKAYTAWMRNFGEDTFASSKVQVIDGAGGSFIPQITYNTIAAADGKVTYNATLVAINSKGEALGGKSIEIKAIGDLEELYSRTLAMNSQGEVSFTFSIPEKVYDTQFLELNFLESENYTVTQKLRLPYSLTLADIQFLPEGGNSVIGKNSTFAFRAVYPDGMPADIKGNILSTELSFESNFAGLGKVDFTPTSAQNEAKIVESKTAQEITVSLPNSTENGLVMQVINNPAASYLTAFVQGNYEPNSLLMVSQTRGVINYMIKGELSSGVWAVRIPKENLFTGINQITVLSADGKALLERLVYFKQDDQISLDLQSTGSVAKREKINLTLKTTLGGTPDAGSFSMAVLDASQVNVESDFSDNIFSSLLLTSDLTGQVYQPGRYFGDDSEETSASLDLVMLTHGWRRFDWTDVFAANYPTIEHFIEQGLNVEGQVTDANDTKKGLSGGKITALVGEGVELVSSEFGPNGRFLFRDLYYLDSASVTITAEDSRLRNFVDINLIEPEPVLSGLSGLYSDESLWSEEMAATYVARARMNQLINGEDKILDMDEVTIEATTIQEEESQMQKVYGSGDVTIDPDNIPATAGLTNIFELIQGRVAGVQVSLAGGNVSITIRGVGTLGGASTEPLYLLDNVPTQASTLLNVNPREVASIDIFKDPASTSIFGVQGANGVIAVYTKTGSSREQSVGGTLVSRVGGYSVAREFYLPKYDTKTAENSILDERSTVYWNPLITTDQNGEAKVELFNTDIAKKLVVVIEGINKSGNLGRTVKYLE